MALCVLGSGSGGNCSVLIVQKPGERRRVILIDAGLGPRTVRSRLAARGVDVREVTDIVLTHLDSDHFEPTWVNFARSRGGITLRVHERHLSIAQRAGALFMRCEPFGGNFVIGQGGGGPEVEFRPLRNHHDELGSYAFRVDSEAGRLGFATDLGRVPDELHEHFAEVDALALESNYCPRMQMESGRPAFLKQRIMGGAGHLSNQESFDAVRAIAKRAALQHVVLLHLSRQCNDPTLIREMYRATPELAARLTITSQGSPTGWMEIGRGSGQVTTPPAEHLFAQTAL